MVFMEMKFDNNIPIYIQLVDDLKMSIISGKYEVGGRLPSVRELAISYKVNPNTIQKALAELEMESLIYTERTNGKYVTKDKALIKEIQKNYLEQLTEKYLLQMQELGYKLEDIIKYLIEIEK